MPELRFECVPGCTNCCRVEGWIYLTEDDLLKAADYVGMTPEAFEAKYIYRTRYTLRFRKPKGGQCHFLSEGGCDIHPAKPTQCRLFPFWPELIEDRRSWNETARNCPGIGHGPLIQIGPALETANEMRTAYPTHYK